MLPRNSIFSLRLRGMSRLRTLLCLLLAYGLAPAQAETDARFSWGGFGTLGVVYNDSDDMEFVRDLNQPRGVSGGWSAQPDSLLGLQGRYRLSEDWSATVQVVSRYTYNSSYRPKITWGFLKYSPDPGLDLRLGRVAWDIYMLSDARNVGYSYLWVRPPLEYFALQQVTHIDGADLVLRRDTEVGLFWTKLYAGYADEKIALDAGDSYDLTGTRVLGGNLNYQTRDWWLRLGYAQARLDNEADGLVELEAALAHTGLPQATRAGRRIRLEDATIEHFTAGVVYERGPMLAQALYDRGKSDSLSHPKHDSWYLLFGYRIADWTPFIATARTRADRPSLDTGLPADHPLTLAAQQAVEGGITNQRSFSVGVRYDFMPSMALKLQLDRIKARDAETVLVRRPQPDWDGRATVFSATLDFIF